MAAYASRTCRLKCFMRRGLRSSRAKAKLGLGTKRNCRRDILVSPSGPKATTTYREPLRPAMKLYKLKLDRGQSSRLATTCQTVRPMRSKAALMTIHLRWADMGGGDAGLAPGVSVTRLESFTIGSQRKRGQPYCVSLGQASPEERRLRQSVDPLSHSPHRTSRCASAKRTGFITDCDRP